MTGLLENLENEKNYDDLIVSIEASYQSLNILIAVCDDSQYRDQIIQKYETELSPNIPCYRVELAKGEPSLRAAIASVVENDEYLQTGKQAVITVTGADGLRFLTFDEEKSEQEKFFGYLQWTREALREFPFSIVLWVTFQMERNLSKKAPDFWAWRKGVFRFISFQKKALPKQDVDFLRPVLGARWDEVDDDDPHFLPVADLQDLISDIEREKGERDASLVTLYGSLGKIFYRRVESGEYEDYQEEVQKAIGYFQKAIGLQQELGLEEGLASNLNYLAELYRSQGRYSEAEPLYKQAIEIDKIALPENHPSLATHLNNLANLYRSQGRYSEAELLFQQAIKIVKIALPENHPDLARDLNNLAKVYCSQGRYLEAEPLLQQAIEIDKIALPPNHPSLARELNNLAKVYCSQGRYLEAEPLLQQAIEIDKIALSPNHPSLARELNNLALLLAKTHRPKQAFKLMLKASKIQDQTIQVIFASSSDRLAYIKEKVRPNLETFLSLVHQYLPHWQAAEQAALNLVLKRKALTLTALAAQNQAVFSGRYPQLKEIFQKWRQKCDQLLAFTYQVPPPEKRETHKQKLAQLQAECNELERQLARQVPEIAMQEQMGDRRAVALELPEGAKLLEFVRFRVFDFQNDSWQKARYLAFVLAGGKPSQVEMIDLGEAENIDRLISVYRESVMKLPSPESGISPQPPLKSMWDDEPDHYVYVYDSQPGKQLREAVFDKLRNKLAGCSHLVLAPDGDLNLVPFEILPEDDDTTILQDKYNISYVSVGRELLRRRIETKGTANQPLIIADPNFDWPQNDPGIGKQEEHIAFSAVKFQRLKATADFAKNAGQMLGVKPFLQNEATGDRLLKCQSPKLLIIATCGYYFQREKEYLPFSNIEFETFKPNRHQAKTVENFAAVENPMMRSAMAFTGANTWFSGGKLPPDFPTMVFAQDIAGVDLWETELAILIVGESGLGDVQTGEGVFGFRRAFAVAGSKTLIMSLWTVPTLATMLLMEQFLDYLRAGIGRTEALKKAQKYLINVTVGELEKSKLGRDILAELPLINQHEIDSKPLTHPYFWGAWVCQGKREYSDGECSI